MLEITTTRREKPAQYTLNIPYNACSASYNVPPMEPRWQSKGRSCAKPGPPSSVSERNCFSASFDERCFQVRKLETGVPEGTHTSMHHTEKHTFSIFRHERGSCWMEGEMKIEFAFCEPQAELTELWQAAGVCLAMKHTVPRHKVLELALKEYRMETCITHIQSRMEKLI